MIASTLFALSNRDRIAWAALAVYFFVLPIAGTTGLRNVVFLVLIVCTALLFLQNKFKPELPFPLFWLAYVLVATNSVFFAVVPSLSWSELRVEVFYWIIITVIGVAWGRRLPDFRIPAVILATINATLTLSAFYFVSLEMDFATIQKIPGYAYAGLDGNWLLVVVFLSCWLAWRQWLAGSRALPLLLIGLVILDIWAMTATHNRQNLVALGAGTFVASAFLLAKKFTWRRAFAAFLVLTLAASLITFQMLRREGMVNPFEAGENNVGQILENAGEHIDAATAKDVRWQLWKFSLDKIAEHPWIGGGIGRGVFDKQYPDFMPENKLIWHAHNMILNKGIQMGIPGMLVFFALWVALALELLRHARKPQESAQLAIAGFAAVTAIFTKNMTDDFFVRNNALLFWLIVGLMIGYLRALATDQDRLLS